jgi:monofunctional biosynthetic peptidoglycan transglycosylase
METTMALVPLILLTAGAQATMPIDPTDPSEPTRWLEVHDTVMGGRSHGTLRHEDGHLVFAGQLSLANRGGFASVRTLPQPFPLADHQGLTVRVRGDGRTYRLRLRDDERLDGPAWQFEFATVADEWIQVTAPFSSFVATFRGRRVAVDGPLDPGRIRQLGFMVADKQAGPFRLEIGAMGAY